MTDKQIIIDGVDVSECAWCICETDTDPYCKINDGEDLGCEDNPNCYYKQLERKTQECEQAEQKLKKIRQVCVDTKDVENIKDMYTAKLSGLYLKSRQILQIIDEVENE